MSYNPAVNWDKRRGLEAMYDEAEKADSFGGCPGCEEDHVLCLVCGYCFKYCHEYDECQL